jgi:tRNA A37 methylthiotransferase MiaB
VLCESVSRRSTTELLGRTDTFRPVIVSAEGVAVGDLVDVVIDRAGPGTLFGRPVMTEHRQP